MRCMRFLGGERGRGRERRPDDCAKFSAQPVWRIAVARSCALPCPSVCRHPPGCPLLPSLPRSLLLLSGVMSLGGRVPSAAALLQLDDDSEMSDAADARPTTAGSSAQEGIDLTADTPHPPKRAKAHKRARDESPGEPTQKAKKSNRSQPQTKSDLIDLADSDQESAGHVAASPRPVKLQRTAPPSVVPGAALSAVSGSTSSAVAAPAPSASHPPEDASDSDVDLVGLGRELGMDLVSPARVPAPVASGLGFETMAGTDGPPTTGKGKHEKKAARRYFDGEDISTKCYNCGKVGHISTECTNATVFKPCWLCGLRGHPAFRCTRELCFRCMKEGHQSRDCTNPKVFIKCCFWCGSSQHAHTECQAKGGSVDLTGIRCYVCGERGHLNCAISSAAPTTINTVSCSNCGLTGHSAQACTEERMPMNLTVDNWGNVQGENGTPGKNNRTPRKDWKADMECFYCNEKGHMKMGQPRRRQAATWCVNPFMTHCFLVLSLSSFSLPLQIVPRSRLTSSASAPAAVATIGVRASARVTASPRSIADRPPRIAGIRTTRPTSTTDRRPDTRHRSRGTPLGVESATTEAPGIERAARITVAAAVGIGIAICWIARTIAGAAAAAVAEEAARIDRATTASTSEKEDRASAPTTIAIDHAMHARRRRRRRDAKVCCKQILEPNRQLGRLVRILN